MEGIEYYIDDMITLPGFVHRHLALMRELDQRAYEAQLKANELELEYFKLDVSQHSGINFSDKKANSGVGNKDIRNLHDLLNGKVILTPITRPIPDDSSKAIEGINTDISSVNADDSNQNASCNGTRSRSKNSPPTSKDTSVKNATIGKESMTSLVENIQKYRQESVLALREKINVNDQLVCMLKHENERMKHQFDIIYRAMEKNGQLPLELKFKVENGIDLKEEYEIQSASGFSSDCENFKYNKSDTNRMPSKTSTSDTKHSRYLNYDNDKNVTGVYKKSYGESYDDVWDGICPVCNKGEDAQDEFGMVGCDSCNNWFHFHCVNYSNTCRDEPWFCPNCESIR
ncbi:CXXC1, SPP1, CPS40 [Babesia microti strain RI]|uniref:Inhibitor of growth protein n=1 Tax=Babesia microti (strain RI) TaxID=1133968 RepID=I7I8M9_BABMR|nr:CXXC1, SPP1, CPS40 [Babesia microti strain RI]CCF73373.1 CXXC1, SPP1, CPS40 [Babesia microti strain RI]|eukprot:XP_012647982.1 CXXC1, SPP1, CPS40 [Babesia microti strain RI]